MFGVDVEIVVAIIVASGAGVVAIINALAQRGRSKRVESAIGAPSDQGSLVSMLTNHTAAIGRIQDGLHDLRERHHAGMQELKKDHIELRNLIEERTSTKE